MKKKIDGALAVTTGERSVIKALVSKLTSRSMAEQTSGAFEIRLLAKINMDNRILLADAGAIAALVSLLRVDDKKTQEHAMTPPLNLSIYDQNKEVIILTGADIPIIEVLRCGNMEAKEECCAIHDDHCLQRCAASTALARVRCLSSSPHFTVRTNSPGTLFLSMNPNHQFFGFPCFRHQRSLVLDAR